MTAPEPAAPTLLLVDDEPANLDLLEAILAGAGYRSLVRTADPREALALFAAHRPDLVLLDLHMPHHSGFEVLGWLRARTPPGDYLPVLVLTADVTSEAKERALSAGARDFLTKPFDVVEVLLRVQNLLETRRLYQAQQRARAAAEAAARRAALLAEASRVLGASLDGSTLLAQLARRLVPDFAELALGAGHGGEAQPAACAHADADTEARLAAALRDDCALARALGRALCRGAGGLVPPEVARRFLRRHAAALATTTLLPGSLLWVPLASARGAQGGLLLGRGPRQAPFDANDLAFARELGRRAGAALENACLFASAQQAVLAREQVLSVVAHDLRNPLASLSMGAEMLLHLLPPRGKSFERETLTTMLDAAARMQRLIADLLEVARLEQGTLTLELRDGSLADVLAEAARSFRPLAEARQIRLEVQTAAGLPTLRLDAARVLQVLSNLLGNALKHTEPGGRVRLAAALAGERVRVSVADTGCGIAPEQVPHVFRPFWQASAGDRRGVGLGLCIARGLVEAHGGELWVESEPGRGATFHFTLPLRAAGARGAPLTVVSARVG